MTTLRYVVQAWRRSRIRVAFWSMLALSPCRWLGGDSGSRAACALTDFFQFPNSQRRVLREARVLRLRLCWTSARFSVSGTSKSCRAPCRDSPERVANPAEQSLGRALPQSLGAQGRLRRQGLLLLQAGAETMAIPLFCRSSWFRPLI